MVCEHKNILENVLGFILTRKTFWKMNISGASKKENVLSEEQK